MEHTRPPLVRDHRDQQRGEVVEVVDTGRIAELERDLAQQQALISAKEQELAHAQAEETRLRNALSIIEQLSALTVDAQAYVLALVCDRTPKAPNPDSSLITPS
jgi:hypothetical protein